MPSEGTGSISPHRDTPPNAPVRPASAGSPSAGKTTAHPESPVVPARQDEVITTPLADRPDVLASVDFPQDEEIAKLIEQLYDDDIEVRDRATAELVKLGKAAIPAVLKILNSSDPEVRVRAREILVRMGEEAVADLAKFMVDGKQDADTRRQVADVLRTIGNALLEGREKPTPRGGPLVLPEIVVPKAVEDIARALREGLKDPALRDAAHEALCSLGANLVKSVPPGPLPWMLADALEELLGPAALPAALKASEPPSSPNEPVLRLLVERYAGKDRNAVIAILQEAVQNHGNPATRALAAQLLADLGDPSAGERLLAVLKEHPDVINCPEVVETLGRLKVKGAVPYLVDILKTSSDEFLLQAAVEALGEIGDKAAAGALLTLAMDPAYRDGLRAMAAHAAKALLGPEEVARRIIPELDPLRQPDTGRRKAAMEALGALKDDAMIPGILQALHDPDAAVRAEAVRALGYKPGPHFPLLIVSLHDPDPRVRQAMLSIVYTSEDPELLFQLAPALMAALDDPDPEVRRMAVGALRHATRTVFDKKLSTGLSEDLDMAERMLKESIDALQKALQKEEDPQIREALEWALKDLKS